MKSFLGKAMGTVMLVSAAHSHISHKFSYSTHLHSHAIHEHHLKAGMTSNPHSHIRHHSRGHK